MSVPDLPKIDMFVPKCVSVNLRKIDMFATQVCRSICTEGAVDLLEQVAQFVLLVLQIARVRLPRRAAAAGQSDQRFLEARTGPLDTARRAGAARDGVAWRGRRMSGRGTPTQPQDDSLRRRR